LEDPKRDEKSSPSPPTAPPDDGVDATAGATACAVAGADADVDDAALFLGGMATIKSPFSIPAEPTFITITEGDGDGDGDGLLVNIWLPFRCRVRPAEDGNPRRATANSHSSARVVDDRETDMVSVALLDRHVRVIDISSAIFLEMNENEIFIQVVVPGS